MKYAAPLFAAFFLWAPLAHADDALATAQKAYDAAWEAAPLTVQKAVLLQGKAEGFGIYTERADNVFKPNDAIEIYSEPVGYGYKDNGDGTLSFGFVLDLSITQADGTVVFSQDNWQEVGLTSREKNHEFMLTITLDFADTPPPAGDYVLTFTIHDKNSTETAPITMPITIKE